MEEENLPKRRRKSLDRKKCLVCQEYNSRRKASKNYITLKFITFIYSTCSSSC